MLAPDTILQGRYKIIRHLGTGGMATAYLAYDLRFTDLIVVIKENQFGDEDLFFLKLIYWQNYDIPIYHALLIILLKSDLNL